VNEHGKLKIMPYLSMKMGRTLGGKFKWRIKKLQTKRNDNFWSEGRREIFLNLSGGISLLFAFLFSL
jgi:hypothetical protein